MRGFTLGIIFSTSLFASLFAGPALAAPCSADSPQLRACLLQEATQISAGLETPIERLRSLLAQGIALAESGAQIEAIAVFDQLRPDILALENRWKRSDFQKAMVSALALNGSYDSLRPMAEAIENPMFRSDAQVALASTLIREGRQEQALALLGRLQGDAARIDDAFFRAKLQERIAIALAEAGDFTTAAQATRAIDQGPVQMEAMLEVAAILGLAGDEARALPLLQEVLKRAAKSAPGAARASNIGLAAKVLTRLGRADEALGLLRLTQNSLAQVRLETASDLAALLIRDDAQERAVAMERLSQEIARELANPIASANALIKIANAHADTGNTAAAMELLGQARTQIARIEQAFSRDYLLTELSKSLARAGDTAAALQVAESIATPNTRASALVGIALAR